MGEFIINRIRHYRILLNITQKELADGVASTNYIYMLETEKKKLTMSMAIKLATRFNEIASSKGILLNVKAKELLKPANEIMRDFYLKEFENLKKSEYNFLKFDELLNKCDKNKLKDLQILINREIGENEYLKGSYETALNYLKNVLILIKSTCLSKEIEEIEIDTLNRIGSCYYQVERFQTCKQYLDRAYDKAQEYNIKNDDLMGRVLYNIGLVIYKMDKYDEAILYFDKALELENISDNERTKINMIKANICYKTERYLEAFNLYKEIEKVSKNHLIYYNLSIICENLCMPEESEEYLNKSINLQLEENCELTTDALLQLSYVYSQNNKFKEALICSEKALINAKRFMQVDKYIKCYKSIFEDLKCMEKLKEFEEYVESIIFEINLYYKDYKMLYEITFLLFQYVSQISNSEIGINITKKLKGGIFLNEKY